MIYQYFCEKCEKILEVDFPFGKSKSTIKCDCGEISSKYYGEIGIVFRGDGWSSKDMKIDKQMEERNKKAKRKTRDNHHSPKIVAYDYGNGDVREVKK